MKKLLLLVIIFMLVGAVAFAGEIDWGGSFTFKLGANPKNVLFDHTVPKEFADMSADIEAQIDDNNLLHTSIKGVSGSDDGVTIGDTYLKTDWGFMTTKLGTMDHDSMGYAVTSKEYELATKGIGGPGVYAETVQGPFTISASKYFDSPFGIRTKYSKGIIDGLGIYYSGDVQASEGRVYTETISTVAIAGKVVIGNFSSGGGIKVEDKVWAHGMAAKYSFAPSWIAWGYGYEAGDFKYCVDTGLEFDTYGADLAVSHVEKIDEVNISAWYKPNIIKLKAGYDWKADENDEVFIEVSADF